MTNIISIDPGNQKCGLLLADLNNSLVIDGKIVLKNYVINLINDWIVNYSVELILLGDGTSSKYWRHQLSLNNSCPIQLVNESRTTLRARERFFELCPPKFPFSSLPKTLLFPPKNLDAIAALILIEDYFEKKFQWLTPLELKTWP